uniref:Jacalin-type lectin domain-containing protein n=1 Tax=Chelonoidis abingdonii TaxID=106734 RepID=A0A8C0G1F9_CHEAB
TCVPYRMLLLLLQILLGTFGTQWTGKGMGIWGATQILRVRGADSTLSSPPSLQFQFDGTWSKTFGYEQGKDHEVTLFRGEEITQISGKNSTYVFQLIFSTNRGRIFFFGQPAGESFNAYPLEQGKVLALVSGHHNELNSIWANGEPPVGLCY